MQEEGGDVGSECKKTKREGGGRQSVHIKEKGRGTSSAVKRGWKRGNKCRKRGREEESLENHAINYNITLSLWVGGSTN